MNEEELAQYPPDDDREFRPGDAVALVAAPDKGPRGRMVEVRRINGVVEWPAGHRGQYMLEDLVLYLKRSDPRARTEVIRLREAVAALQEATQRIYAPRDGIMPSPETRHMRMVSVPEPYVAMLSDTVTRVMNDLAELDATAMRPASGAARPL